MQTDKQAGRQAGMWCRTREIDAGDGQKVENDLDGLIIFREREEELLEYIEYPLFCVLFVPIFARHTFWGMEIKGDGAHYIH
jgi:hypothetical protein